MLFRSTRAATELLSRRARVPDEILFPDGLIMRKHGHLLCSFTALLALLAACGMALADSAQDTLLLRFPDIRGDRVAFSHAGDIWTVSAAGGVATRITSDTGLELFPKFSPDGRWIAFTGEYEGDEQVYVIPAEGGQPRQLTFYPARGPLLPRQGHDNQVHGWSPDGRFVLLHSMRDSAFITEPRLYAVPFAGLYGDRKSVV